MSHYHPHSHKKNKILKQNHMLDILIYPIAFLSPIMTIPQVVDVWVNKDKGVSVTTWASYAIVSGFWLIYAIHHKEKPVAISSILLLILDSAIVLGVFLH